MSTTLNSCGGGSSQKVNAQQPKEPETEVLIRTTLGDIKVKLYNETPMHRNNFVLLAEQQFYDSVMFHRVIKNFMIQTGDPDSKSATKGDRLGAGGPGYTIDAEFVYPQHYHKRGALSAARMADQMNPERKSSGSQFYIVTGKKYGMVELDQLEKQMHEQSVQELFNKLCYDARDTIEALRVNNDTQGLRKLQDEMVARTSKITKERGPFRFTPEQRQDYNKLGGAPFLDKQYTVFGEVIEGMEVVDKIEKVSTDANDRPREDVRILSMEIVK